MIMKPDVSDYIGSALIVTKIITMESHGTWYNMVSLTVAEFRKEER